MRDLILPEKGLGHNDRDHAAASGAVGAKGGLGGDGDATSVQGDGNEVGDVKTMGEKAPAGLVERGIGIGAETGKEVDREVDGKKCEDCG